MKLGKTERTLASVLFQHGALTHGQLALLSGYSPKASTIGVSLSKMRKLDYVEDGQPIRLSIAGALWIKDRAEVLPEGQALIDYWRHRFGKTERICLDALLQLHPQGTDLQEMAQMTGYSPSASTIGVAMSKLRKVGVAESWALSPDFAMAAGL